MFFGGSVTYCPDGDVAWSRRRAPFSRRYVHSAWLCVLADSFGMETVVWPYAAGMAIAMLAGAAKDETLQDRLT